MPHLALGEMLHFSAKSSIYVNHSYVCMDFRMPDLLTTDEAAAYLRLSERKLYELVANGVVPCTQSDGQMAVSKTGPRSRVGGWSAPPRVGARAGAADRRRQPRSA